MRVHPDGGNWGLAYASMSYGNLQGSSVSSGQGSDSANASSPTPSVEGALGLTTTDGHLGETTRAYNFIDFYA